MAPNLAHSSSSSPTPSGLRAPSPLPRPRGMAGGRDEPRDMASAGAHPHAPPLAARARLPCRGSSQGGRLCLSKKQGRESRHQLRIFPGRTKVGQPHLSTKQLQSRIIPLPSHPMPPTKHYLRVSGQHGHIALNMRRRCTFNPAGAWGRHPWYGGAFAPSLKATGVGGAVRGSKSFRTDVDESNLELCQLSLPSDATTAERGRPSARP